MNTETPIASATNRLLPEKDCYGTDSQVATLNVITDHQRSYQLAYTHFTYSGSIAESVGNSVREKGVGVNEEGDGSGG